MTPVYFPFTFLSQPVAEALTAFFGPIVVYQPLVSNIPQIIKNLEMNGLIDIRVPLKSDEEKIIQWSCLGLQIFVFCLLRHFYWGIVNK